jgi:hypothetical protein
MDSNSIFKNNNRENSYQDLLEKSQGEKVFYDADMNAWIVFGYNECRQALESSFLSKKRIEIPINILGESKKEQVKIFLDILNTSMIFGSEINKDQRRYWKDFLFKNLAYCCEKSLDHVAGHLSFNHQFNIAETITYPYNSHCISQLFSLSEQQTEYLLPLARKYAWLLDGKIESKEAFSETVDATLLAYDFFSKNHQTWKNDFAVYDEKNLTADLLLVYSAAQDTTAHLINKCIFELANQPNVLADLKTQQIKVKQIIMECLRLLSPITAIGRTCQTDILINKTALRKGERLLLYVGYANYDKKFFEDPFNFNLNNLASPPLSFGHGEGKCIGMQVALTLSEQFLTWFASNVNNIKIQKTEYSIGTAAYGIDKLTCVLE